jgi:hypothetical protein
LVPAVVAGAIEIGSLVEAGSVVSPVTEIGLTLVKVIVFEVGVPVWVQIE